MARLHVRGAFSRCARNCWSNWRLARHQLVELPDARGEHGGNPHVVLCASEEYSPTPRHQAPAPDARALQALPPSTRFSWPMRQQHDLAVHYLPQRRNSPHDTIAGPHATRKKNRSRSGNASWLRVTMDFASMGWAIGAAVGVARGNPNCPVVCITGDGSYLMSGQEINPSPRRKVCGVVCVVLTTAPDGMVMHASAWPGGADRLSSCRRSTIG